SCGVRVDLLPTRTWPDAAACGSAADARAPAADPRQALLHFVCDGCSGPATDGPAAELEAGLTAVSCATAAAGPPCVDRPVSARDARAGCAPAAPGTRRTPRRRPEPARPRRPASACRAGRPVRRPLRTGRGKPADRAATA